MPPTPPVNPDDASPDVANPPRYADAPAQPSQIAGPRRGASRGGPRGPRESVPQELALQQRAVAALFVSLLSLAGLIGLNNWQRGVYVVMFALVAGVVAVWLGVTAMVRARRARLGRPRGAMVAAIVGGLGVLMSALLLLAFAVLGRQLDSYGQCLSGVNTLSDQQACYTQFHHAVNREISVIQGAPRG